MVKKTMGKERWSHGNGYVICVGVGVGVELLLYYVALHGTITHSNKMDRMGP